MNIVVMVKGVPDSEARITVREDGSGLEVEDKNELNYFDELAVEEALRLRERLGAGSVTAVSCGGKRALEAVRKAVAMGVDEAMLIEDTDDHLPDGLGVAKVLAACVKSVDYDLILCGRKATDDDGSQVGPMVAELLGIPHITAAVRIELSQDRHSLTVTREQEGGWEILRSPLPALLSAQKGLNDPRVPSIQGVMRGMKLQPAKRDPSALDLPREPSPSSWQSLAYSEPPKRPPVQIVEGPDPASKARELVRILREKARVI